MIKKSIRWISLLVVLMMLFTGCTAGADAGATEEPANEEGAAEEMTAVRTDFTIGIPAEPKSLDPHRSMDTWTSAIMINVFDRLVQMDDNGNHEPCLAEKWEIADDGLSVRFWLRDDVKFHNGTDFTAKDVAFSFDRSINSSYSMGATDCLNNIEIINDYEVVLHLNYNYAPILNLVAGMSSAILSEEVMKDLPDEDFMTNPVGTGAYKLAGWQKGDRILLEAFDDYYGGAPVIKNATYRIIMERTTGLIALETGDIDAYVDISGIDRQTVLGNEDLVLLETPSNYRLFIQMDNRVEPFDNKLVRQAIELCFDQQDMIDIALDGAGVPADIALTHPNLGDNFPRKDKPAKDIEKAKELLAEAGYPDGFDTVLHVREDATKVVGQVLQENLREIGINVTLQVVERSAHLEDIINGEVSFSTLMFSDSLLDPGEPLCWNHSKNFAYNGGNFNYCSNPEIDRLVDEQEVQVDVEKRAEIIAELIEIIDDETPFIPVYYPMTNIGYSKDLKGIDEASCRYMYKINELSW
jgi:peptide/nickel transport system substrate-binding protein